ncbi:MAG TPA: PadR family transcriptional regulator [Phycisphaerales bacterium]|nr:PadR family transcriptional regulator [Phycisphaerales bacterium]HMP36208.1 PadR family transcriptional regulator [Phycisphaerales bacterium]
MDTRLLTGTIEMLVLDVLARGESYGYAIAQTVLARSTGRFDLNEGSLYPALHRLERQELIAARWDEASGGRPRKYYRLTPAGRAALEAKREEWNRFSAAVDSVLAPQPLA